MGADLQNLIECVRAELGDPNPDGISIAYGATMGEWRWTIVVGDRTRPNGRGKLVTRHGFRVSGSTPTEAAAAAIERIRTPGWL